MSEIGCQNGSNRYNAPPLFSTCKRGHCSDYLRFGKREAMLKGKPAKKIPAGRLHSVQTIFPLYRSNDTKLKN